jgi:cytochrome c1
MKKYIIRGKNKKAQEESMGFVIIVMIVLVIGVVFLGLSIRGHKTPAQQKQELSDLSWAVLSYTTDCSISSETRDVWHLAQECDIRPGQPCDNGMAVCSALNSTLSDIFNNVIGTNATLASQYIHAYEFVVSMPSYGKMSTKQGNLTGNYFVYNTLIPGNVEDINVTAKFYY